MGSMDPPAAFSLSLSLSLCLSGFDSGCAKYTRLWQVRTLSSSDEGWVGGGRIEKIIQCPNNFWRNVRGVSRDALLDEGTYNNDSLGLMGEAPALLTSTITSN